MTTITNKREKIESRRDSISKEEKQYILSKTHRRCAHCGQKLTIDSEKYTTDHFIPISKSGTNQTENLVPLCYDCNQLKGDYIVHPEDFYKHVSTHYMRELDELYKEYCSKYKWATKTNYTKATLMSVSYLMPLLQQFRESCPSVQLEIESLSKAALQSALGMGTLDVAFIFNTWSEEFPHFVCQPVTRTVPRIYYATKLLGGRKAADVSDFRDLPFIRITHRQPGAYDFLKELPFAPVRVIPADTVKTVQMYVSAGLACAILGSSQHLLDYTGVETFVLQDCTRRVGTDAIWNEGNDNPALFYLEKLIRKEYAASGGPERPDGDGE